MHFNLRLLGVVSLVSTAAIAAPQDGPTTSAANPGNSNDVSNHREHIPAVPSSTPAPTAVGVGVGVGVDPAHVHALMTNETHYDLHHARSLDLVKRTDNLGMYQCQNKGFKPPCTWDGPGVEDGKCRKATYPDVASMGPDKGLKCSLFQSPDCSGTMLYPFQFAGVYDFSTDVWWEAVGAAHCTGFGCSTPPGSYLCAKA